jgi:drug/metabolite transporter (DMT)-like permease
MLKQINIAYKFAFAAVICWSTVATAFKISLEYLTPIQLLFISSIVSLVLLTVFLSFQGRLRSALNFSRKDLQNSALFGFLNPFLYYLILFNAYNLLQAQEAMALNYSWGITIAILSVLILKQKIRWNNFVGLALSFIGVIVIAVRGDFTTLQFESPIGVALALVSSIVWGFYWVLNIKDEREGVVKLFQNFIFSSFYLLILIIFTDGLSGIQWQGWIAGTYVGIFEMGLTFILWMKALKYAENTASVSSIIYLSPFLSMFFIALILKETIYISTIFGLVLIISGIIMQSIKKKV